MACLLTCPWPHTMVPRWPRVLSFPACLDFPACLGKAGLKVTFSSGITPGGGGRQHLPWGGGFHLEFLLPGGTAIQGLQLSTPPRGRGVSPAVLPASTSGRLVVGGPWPHPGLPSLQRSRERGCFLGSVSSLCLGQRGLLLEVTQDPCPEVPGASGPCVLCDLDCVSSSRHPT